MNGSEMASALERVFLDSGHFDLSVLTPGSPAYVRRLRDQAALEFTSSLIRIGEPPDKVSEYGIEHANEWIAALGYQVPDGEATS